MQGGDLPDLLSKAGTVGRAVIPPPETKQDQFDVGLYWWRFRNLLDLIKGDEHGNGFLARQKIARETFDELERTWDARVAKAEAEAVTLRKQGQREKAAKTLAALTAACIEEAVAAVERVKAHLTSASGERLKARLIMDDPARP